MKFYVTFAELKILYSALKLLSKKGAKITRQDILKETGLSKSSLSSKVKNSNLIKKRIDNANKQ